MGCGGADKAARGHEAGAEEQGGGAGEAAGSGAAGVSVRILHGDCRTVLPTLPDASVQCCVTSPPYYNLRDYQTSGQIGLEATVQEYVAELVRVFRGVKRVLRDDGTLWLNLGSSYASGGKRPNQSPLPSRALACDTGDTEPLGAQAPGCACPDRHGERSSGCLCRHGRTPGTAQQHQPDALPHGPKAHGSALPDCAGASLVGAFPSSLASTTPASAQSVPAVTSLADAASACLSSRPTSSPLSLASSRNSGGTIDTSQHRPTSESHTKGRDVSGAACGAPDCDGCGICWSYLAIPALRFKSKDLMGIPALVAFALQADGWYLRSSIVWAKPNPMPESVRDRPTSAHEHVFLLSKRGSYYYDADAIAEQSEYPEGSRPDVPQGGFNGKGADPRGQVAFRAIRNTRNARNVWTIATQPYSGAHFATMPPELAERCIKAGTKPGDTVLDPFGGAGTTGLVADRLGRNAILIELNPEYRTLAADRITADAPLFAGVA